MILVYRKLLHGLEQVLKVLIAVFLFAMVIIATVEVFRRYVLGLSFVWADELVRFAMVWMTFLGGAYGYRKKELISFDFLQNAIPEKFKALGQLVITLIGLVFVAFIFKIGLEFSLSDVSVGQESMCMRISMVFVYISIPVGMGAMILFMLDDIISFFKRDKKGGTL